MAAASSSDPWIPLPGRLRRRFLQPRPKERSRARGFQNGRRRIEEIYMGRVRGGGKRRRLPTGDSQPEFPAAPAEAESSALVTDAPPTPETDTLAAMLEEGMSEVAPPSVQALLAGRRRILVTGGAGYGLRPTA